MLDGVYPLLNDNGTKSEYRDESSRSGIQHEAGYEHQRGTKTHRGNAELNELLLALNKVGSNNEAYERVFTRPGPKAAVEESLEVGNLRLWTTLFTMI